MNITKNDIKNTTKTIMKIMNNQRIVPFASGAVSIHLLSKVINSKLQEAQYFTAIGSSLFIFLLSVIAYLYLSKIEKDKDTAILDMTKRIIEAVYKHFGVAMANKDATSTADMMNPLMQSITNLVKEFQNLSVKRYKD